MLQTRQKVFRIVPKCLKMSQNVPKCPKMSQNVPKCPKMSQNAHFRRIVVRTDLFVSKNHAYKNVEAQIYLKFKNIVVILLVAISSY